MMYVSWIREISALTCTPDACRRMSKLLNIHLSRWLSSSRAENDHETAHVGQLCMGASPSYIVVSLVNIKFPLQLFRVDPAVQRLHKRPFRAQGVERQPPQLVQRGLRVRMCVCLPGFDLYCVGTFRGVTDHVHSIMIVRQL
jgi:hypothetical protein